MPEDRAQWVNLILDSLQKLEQKQNSVDDKIRSVELELKGSAWKIETIQTTLALLQSYEQRITQLETEDKLNLAQSTALASQLADLTNKLEQIQNTASQNTTMIEKVRNIGIGIAGLLGLLWTLFQFLAPYISFA